MNFKLVPMVCQYCRSNPAEKDGKVVGVKPWMIHLASMDMLFPEGKVLQELKTDKKGPFSTVSFIVKLSTVAPVSII